MKDFEYEKAVLIIQQADAFLINTDPVTPLIRERVLESGEKYLSFFCREKNNSYSEVHLYEKCDLKFDGQTFEIKEKHGYEWTLTPLLKLKKWEDY